MIASQRYKIRYGQEKQLDTLQWVYSAVLSFPHTNKTNYHISQSFEIDMAEHARDMLFAAIVMDELVPKLREELPHLFGPNPITHPDEPFVGMLRGKPVRRSDTDWETMIQDPAFLLNPNVRIT